ncbi:unnamed protein product [Rhizoctonia solani]|uniref:DUF7598 domain-containing protein n=1 Tax=Rhizoctonia solani TaxID=456999 RepID=A0A8H2XTZ3_9AGAM|nr:unnamed protein product [Rhizoctonia solani]
MLPLGLNAYTFLGLNAVRALSILTLILVFASSIMVMVDDVNAVRRGNDVPTGPLTDASGNEFDIECDYFEASTVPLQPAGVFFAILNRLFIIAQCIILVLAELGFPQSFFKNFLPVLGPDHGVGILGAMQVFLGAAVLSHHVPTFALVSAFFLFSIGLLNIILGLVFRSGIHSRRALLSWRNKAPSALTDKVDRATTAVSYASDVYSSFRSHSRASDVEKQPLQHDEKHGEWDIRSQKSSDDEKSQPFAALGFGRKGQESAEKKGFIISKPLESLPKYAPKQFQLTANFGSGRASN